ncbi:hypothetical protein Taro_027881 [Colocasia esculenta]|uniref:Uncharacterized protein n=1 Tax=Colocasia esculenta TaxID=4460 RepID=A0A843VNS9_COLES|nr:hypothetical protein [Colocasia esculenta]
MWLLGVSRGDTWLFLPDLVEVWDVGACVVRLWSHMVAPVFRELLCLGGCMPRCACRGVCFRIMLDSAGSVGVVFGLTRVVVELFEFIAYLTGLNSNPSGSSDPWVAARPSGVPGGGPGARVVTAKLLPFGRLNGRKSASRHQPLVRLHHRRDLNTSLGTGKALAITSH